MENRYPIKMKTSLLPHLAIFLFILLAISAKGQKEAFEKIFEKETQQRETANYGRFKNIERVSFYPDTLPSWFFSPPASSSESTFAIGISDPDLLPNEAIFQAMHRAKSMAILQHKAYIQYYRDVYTVAYSEQTYKGYGQRFDTYFRLSAAAQADSGCFTTEKVHLTRYNEAVVLLRYSPSITDSTGSSSSLKISTVGTALYIEAQIDNVFEPQAEYEIVTQHLTPNGFDINSHFTYREKGRRFLAISEFMGNERDFPLYNYKYCNPSWEVNKEPLISYNGLWSIYSKKLLRQLTLNTEETSINIRSLDEMYSPEMRNLTREVAIKTAQMHINGIEFGVDSIGFDINVIELK